MEHLSHIIPDTVQNIDAYVEGFLSAFEKRHHVYSAGVGGNPAGEITLDIAFLPKEIDDDARQP